MLDLLVNPHAWAALVTLTALEIVLGIDNVVFISILVSRLEQKSANRARKIGILLAFVFRILLLLTLTWIMGLTAPVFTIVENVTAEDVFVPLLVGGLADVDVLQRVARLVRDGEILLPGHGGAMKQEQGGDGGGALGKNRGHGMCPAYELIRLDDA